ncbi:MAG: cytochrome c [Acidobacteriia bacterium]|nr:cytochrome c [Terriglobia bacterium]
MVGTSAVWFAAAGWIAAAALAAGPAVLPEAKKTAKGDRGRELVLEVCTYCHEIERVTHERLTKEEWRGLIKGMISEGPPVTDDEFSTIVDYLAKNFGEKNP